MQLGQAEIPKTRMRLNDLRIAQDESAPGELAAIRRLIAAVLARAVQDRALARDREHPELAIAKRSAEQFLRSEDAEELAAWLGVPREAFRRRCLGTRRRWRTVCRRWQELAA